LGEIFRVFHPQETLFYQNNHHFSLFKKNTQSAVKQNFKYLSLYLNLLFYYGKNLRDLKGLYLPPQNSDFD